VWTVVGLTANPPAAAMPPVGVVTPVIPAVEEAVSVVAATAPAKLVPVTAPTVVVPADVSSVSPDWSV